MTEREHRHETCADAAARQSWRRDIHAQLQNKRLQPLARGADPDSWYWFQSERKVNQLARAIRGKRSGMASHALRNRGRQRA